MLFVHLHVCGQTGSQNYVMSVSYDDSLRNNCVTQVCYFDGLGNRTMTVADTGGQDGYVGSYQEYDLLGRESRAWLPVPASSQLDFADIDEFRQAAVDYYSDSRPYSESHYDALGRVTKVDGEGMAWKTAGRSSVMRYGSNSGGEVMLFEASHGGVFLRGYYAAGELTSHISIDEDGRVVKVFKDIRDRTVMERRATDNDTYYVYDTKGNLSYVLPPELSRVMTQVSGVWTSADNSLKSLAFIYEYDEYGRCVRKKLPGCGYVETGYDNDSRVAIVSDGNLRQSGRCRFFLYDKAGRTVVQGTCACPSGQTSSMSFVAAYTGNGEYGGYSFNGNLADVALMQVDYYDGYSFLDYYGDSIKAEIDFSTQEGFDTPKSFTRGMHTGAAVYMVGDNPARSISASYYDHKGREICTKRTNHVGGKEQYWRRYTFTGNVETVLHIHSAKGRNTRTERMCYEYDTSGRMLKATHALDGGTPTVIADCVYDSVGRLHANMRNGNGSLTTTYGYNLRSWVTSISGPLFSESIGYNENNGNTPQWGGNISSVTWQCDSVSRGYNYRYDSMSRLTDALYVESGVPSPKYDTSYTYDANGNLLNLQRHGMLDDLSYGLIDNLDYVYDGNQLVSVSDTETGPNYKGAFHFADRSSAATEYEYDENGNMTKDLNKKITSIQYNLLNLPSEVDFESGNYMEYKYDAKGSKLMSVHISIPFLDVSPGIVKGGKWEGGLENTPRRLSGRPKPGIFPSDSLYLDEKQFVEGYTQYEYCDNLIYENEELSQVLFDGGYISIDGRTGMSKYHFYLRDHLGSNRVVADAAGTVEQVSHYYPYGGLMADISTNQDMQRFRFQGKELDRFENIDWNDHGARHADLQTGRWNTVDPLAEKYYNVSPYVYCMNNPVMLVDPDGKKIEDGSIKEWNKLRKNIESKRDKLQSRINNLNAKAEKKGWSSEKLSNKTGNLLERVTSLNNSLNTMIILEKSNQVYRLSEVTGIGYLSHDTNTNIISINFVTTENFVHEMTHAGQFETGDIAFLNGGTALQDIYDEVAAYKAQFAYNPFSVSALSSTSPAKSFEEISPTWVQGLKDGNGNAIYAPGGAANTGIFPVNINSTRDDIIQSYPWNATHLRGLPSNIRLVPGLYYKR